MECNKEEAFRARGIAEHKMQNGDFEGAKKFALKAQKMFPELDNISQLLTVCNVHCCAKHKLYGSEMDWYGILRIEQSADESSIKKQYGKLALLLHPDKNKFAGAEAAFKLIGEANKILSDQLRRSQYDMKCRISVKTSPKPPSHPSSRASSVNNKYGSTYNFQNGSSKFTASYTYPQAQHVAFWTICSTCGIRYQYYKYFMNRLLRCPTCGSSFIARDLGPQGCSSSQFSNQKEVPNQGPCKVSSQCNGGKSSSVHFPHIFAGPAPIMKAGSSVQVSDSKKQEKVGVQMHQPHEGFTAQQKLGGFSNVRDRKEGVEIAKPNAAKPKGSGTSRNAKKKRGRESVEESDDSCETGSEIEVEHGVSLGDCSNSTGPNSKVNGCHPPRRSSRQKQHVSYEEKLIDDDDDDDDDFDDDYDDDDFVSSPYKRSKVDDDVTKKDNSVGPAAAVNSQKEVKRKASALPEDTVPYKKSITENSQGKEEEPVIFDNNNKMSHVDSGCASSADVNLSPQVFEYPDPEFSDFQMQRAENCFAVNQVWAIYDALDGMPRFYAQVKKVFNPGFKLRITWLEPNPDKENEQNWVDTDLPISCGKYCNGSSETCVDRLIFSHQIASIKHSGKCFFLVYPQKGETWALFREWDVKWASEPEKHKPPYQFDFVEVLTDFDEEIGIGVANLGKVKGSVCIFQQTERDGVISFQVSSQELYRFSHRIPSFRMTGKEREGVPVGSFELDPASIPTNPDELVDPGESKLGNHNLDNAENYSSPKIPQNQAKEAVDSEENLTPMTNEKSDIEREAPPFRRSMRGSSCMLKEHGQVDAGQYKNRDDSIGDIHDCNFTLPKGSSSSSDAVEKRLSEQQFRNCQKLCKDKLVKDKLEEVKRKEEDLEKCLREFELKEEQFDLKVKSFELEKKGFEERCKELEFNEKQYVQRYKEVEAREKMGKEQLEVIKRMEEDFGLKKEHLEKCYREFELKEKAAQSKVAASSSIQISIQRCSKQLKAAEEELASIKNSILECTKELESKQQYLEAIQKSQEQLSDVLESKEKQLDLVEKACSERLQEVNVVEKHLDSLKRSLEERLEKLETEKRQFEARIKEFKLKQKQFDSVQMAAEQRSKELELKEKQLTYSHHCKVRSENPSSFFFQVLGITNTKTVNPITPNQIKTEQPEHSSADLGAGDTMDGWSLQGIPDEHLDEPDLRQNEVLVALQMSPDPAKFVLDLMLGICSQHQKKGGTGFEESVLKIYVLMLEQLLQVSPLVQPNVKADALKLAIEWKVKIKLSAESSIEIMGFLLFVAAFGLVSYFNRDEIFKFLGTAAQHLQARNVCWVPGFTDLIPDFVHSLIARKQYTEAVKFFCAFDCKDKFPPGQLLNRCWEKIKRVACDSCEMGKNSPEVQEKATDEQIVALRSVIECIKDCKLERSMRVEVIEKCIAELEKEKR